MSSLADLAAAVDGLKGCHVVDVGRTLNMVEVGLRRDQTTYRLHVQCPFRVVQGAKIVLGSFDVHYPIKRGADKDIAFDTYATQFDRSAKILTERLGPKGFPVLEAQMKEDGAFFFEIVDDVRFEVFPAVSGPIECWRLFEKGSDVHYVYPVTYL
jgi:hypothetical protein